MEYKQKGIFNFLKQPLNVQHIKIKIQTFFFRYKGNLLPSRNP